MKERLIKIIKKLGDLTMKMEIHHIFLLYGLVVLMLLIWLLGSIGSGSEDMYDSINKKYCYNHSENLGEIDYDKLEKCIDFFND